MTKHACKCGKAKPYRRAFSCKECWGGMKAEVRRGILLVGRGNGNGTLRAGREAKAGKIAA